MHHQTKVEKTEGEGKNEGEEQITIACPGGESIEIPFLLAQQSGYMKHALEFNELRNQNSRVHITLDDCLDNYYSSKEQPLMDKAFVEEEQKQSVILQKTVECFKDERKIQELNIEEIDDIYATADFLVLSRQFFRMLLLHKKQSVGQLNGEDQRKFIVHCDSIRNLLREGTLEVDFWQLNPELQQYGLRFDNHNIESLDGLELLVQDLPALMKESGYDGIITIVDFAQNKLETVDVEQILHYFPHIWGLGLSDNCIKNIKLPFKLPNGFQLGLSDNNIENLPLFKLGEGEHGFVDLKGNPLTKEAKLACLQAGPSFVENQRHRIKALADKRMWKWGLGGTAVGMAFGAIAAIVGLVLFDKTITKIDFQGFLKVISREKNLIFMSILGSAVGQGLWFAGVQYWFDTYNDNLIYQYRPGEILVDEEDSDDEKKD